MKRNLRLYSGSLLNVALAVVLPLTSGAREDNASRVTSVNTQQLVFVENAGQVTDQHQQPRSDIHYVAAGNAISLFIGTGALHYMWYKVLQNGAAAHSSANDKSAATITLYRLDAELLGCNKHAVAVAEDPKAYKERYYLPNCKGRIASSYGKITYKDIYPNIDWVLYTNNGASNGLKYDFIVHPGGRPSDIRIKYTGATSVALDGGSVIAKTEAGAVTEQKPYVYDASTHQELASSYRLKNNVLSFDVAPTDHEMVIDPQLNWATYYANPGSTGPAYFPISSGMCSAADTFGNSYLCGSTFQTFGIASTGASQQVYGGGALDGFIVQFGLGGARNWATYFGGSGTDQVSAATCDAAGNLYVTGKTTSTSGIAGTIGSVLPQQTANGGSVSTSLQDAFLAKFDINGVYQWGTYVGGPGEESGLAVACDKPGSVYVGGSTTTNSGSNMFSALPFQNVPGDGFIGKYLGSTGQRQWGTYYNGTVTSIVIDNKNSVIIGGYTKSTTGVASSNVYKSSFGSSTQLGFIAKFNSSNGGRSWGTYYGGENSNEIRAVTCDSLYYIYAGGTTTSTTGISGGNALISSIPNSYINGMLVKLDSAGKNRVWGTYYPGYINAMAMTPDSKLYFGGITCNSNIATPGAYQTTFAGPPSIINPPTQVTLGIDGFLGKFDLDGNRKWGSYFGGPDYEDNISIAYGANKLYISGTANSDTMIATSNGYQIQMIDSILPFLGQFQGDTNVYIKFPYQDTLLCSGSQLNVTYNVTNKFRPGNVFTVQISDASGNFATPTNIGSATTSDRGVIACTIPTTFPATGMTAVGYKIRIISSLPADTFYNYNVPIRISKAYKPEAVLLSSQVCEGSALYINDANAPAPAGATFIWTGPGGYIGYFSTVTIPAVGLFHTGNFYVEVDNYTCKGRDTIAVVVTPRPADPVITGDTSVCRGDTLRLHASSTTPGVTYQWINPKFQVQQTADFMQPYIDFSDLGIYRVAAYNGACASALIGRYITVHNLPNPTPGSPRPSVCVGDSIILTATDTIPGVSYKWAGPANFSSANPNNVILDAQPSQGGKYVVTTTTAFGCKASRSLDIQVKPYPNDVIAASDAPRCEGQDLHLSVDNATPDANYTWTGPNGFNALTQTAVIPNVPASQQGIYTVVADLHGCKTQDTMYVEVDITPDTPRLLNNGPIMTGAALKLTILNPQPGCKYAWTGPNNFFSEFQNPVRGSVVPADSGLYTATISFGACSTSDTMTVVITQDTTNRNVKVEPKMYPNPTDGKFTIYTPTKTTSDVQIIVYASDGREVHREVVKLASKLLNHTINITGVANGVYRMKLVIDNKVMFVSFTIKV